MCGFTHSGQRSSPSAAFLEERGLSLPSAAGLYGLGLGWGGSPAARDLMAVGLPGLVWAGKG